MRFRYGLTALATIVAAPAGASDTPLYQPAPAWIVPAPPIDPAKLDEASPVFLVYDSQQRIERGRVWSYLDTARRASSAEVLGQIGTVSVPWLPDKGDLIVHRAEILRGTERIDLLKTGTRFVVLRREDNLEQRQLTGALTATMAVQGLQIGDVLRVSFSLTQTDAALKGHGQAAVLLPTEPFRTGFARALLSWPAGDDVRWKMMSGDTVAPPKLEAGYRTLSVALPLPKPAELPADVPARFRKLPLLAAGDFADWTDVSRTMTPLFATENLIAPGSPLAAEVDKIRAADQTPLGRTQRALELVQDKIRYLALGMNGGNYVPQTAAQTWELRYGDCKAKTLMLLAMLRAMGVEAEAVLATVQNGDMLSAWLPMPGAFNHVLVRATVAGDALWLDGTGSGARLADIHDTPPFRWVLPLRAAGTGLLAVPMRPDARPTIDVAFDFDERAGVDFPRLFHATITLRGALGAALGTMAAQVTPKQKTEALRSLIGQYVELGQIGESAVRYDAPTGTAIVTASGLLTTAWRNDDKKMRHDLDTAVGTVTFAPDRARPAWRELPVSAGDSGVIAWHSRITLPQDGVGYTFEGDRTLAQTLGGVTLARTTTMTGAVVTVDDRVSSTGAEVAPDAVATERARLASAQGRLLRLVAPANTPRRWDIASGARDDARFKPVEAMFAKAIAGDPAEATGYEARASFRAGIFDRRGAIEDLGRAIAIDPTLDLYLTRARTHVALGNAKLAIADAQAARALDPSSLAAIGLVVELLSDSGDSKAALALVDERIALGGKEKADYLQRKADVQADAGDITGALATLDTAITEKRGDPDLLNSRCWIKATRTIALDTALKDCTKAIELADNPNPALDSRAMVYFRMGRSEDALADLDAVLDAAPALAGSRFMRGVILKRAGQTEKAANDLRIARLLSPQIDKDYAKYGITA